MIHLVRLVRDAVLDKKGCRKYFYAAFTIRKAREEAVGDRLIALVSIHERRKDLDNKKPI